MIRTSYIKVIMDECHITQKDLADEWSRTAKAKKYPNNISRILKDSPTIDSISFVQAISNLSKLRVVDLLNEMSMVDQKIIYQLEEPEGDYESANTEIPITNIRSAASALMTAYNPDVDIKGKVSIPKTWIRPGTHKISEISGESMLSTFSPNDLVAYRLLDKNEWEDMRDNFVYEIITNDNDSYTKRVRCNFDRGFITCMSDNLDKNQFPNFNVALSDISQIWLVEFKISWKFPSPYNALDDRFKSLEKDQDEIRHIIRGLFDEMKKIKVIE